VTYANADDIDPDLIEIAAGDRPLLDRWILSRLAATSEAARRGLDAYDATSAAREIARFVDDLSNWYLRLARRRFRGPGGAPAADAPAAHRTLHECLTALSRLMAPFTPFITDAIWRNLSSDGAPESVHLASYPEADATARDEVLENAMRIARDAVSLGRTVRTGAKVRVRQPLARAAIHVPGDPAALDPLVDLVAEELNVKEVTFAEAMHRLSRWSAKPNFRALGPRLGPRVKEVARVLASDDGGLATALAAGESVSVETSEGAVELSPEEVDLSQETSGGWGVAAEGGLTVALDLDVTPELAREGMARELVRLVQDARKAAGLRVSDRIALGVEADGEVAEALREHSEWIGGETLAVSVTEGKLEGDAHHESGAIEGTSVGIYLRTA
jgi:isoleucyl-tRNA synthetase